jgi:hypothetical protein
MRGARPRFDGCGALSYETRMTPKGRVAIAGLGLTPQGKVYDRTHVGFAVEAVRLALEDAGLARTWTAYC